MYHCERGLQLAFFRGDSCSILESPPVENTMKLHENIPCHPVNLWKFKLEVRAGLRFFCRKHEILDRFGSRFVFCRNPLPPSSTQDDEAARKRYLDHLRFGGTTIFLFRFFCGYGRWLWNHMMMMRRNTKLMNMLVVVMVMVIMPAVLKQRYRVIGDPELLFNVFFFFKIVFRGKIWKNKPSQGPIKETHLLTFEKFILLDNAGTFKSHGISFMSSRPSKICPK